MSAIFEIVSEPEKRLKDWIASGRNSTQEHKFNAHERLFKLCLNLSTLILTGWIALAAWRPTIFFDNTWLIVGPCILHVLTLILICIGDVFIMLQSQKEQSMYAEIDALIYFRFQKIDLQLKSLASTLPQPPNTQPLLSAFLIELNKLNDEIKDSVEKVVKKTTRFSNFSWFFGLSGVVIFFVAIFYSGNNMLSFVHKAKLTPQDIKSPSVISGGVSKTPKEAEKNHQ